MTNSLFWEAQLTIELNFANQAFFVRRSGPEWLALRSAAAAAGALAVILYLKSFSV